MMGYVAAAVAVIVLFLLVRFAIGYFRLRGTRVVTCPQDRTNAAVDIDPARAAAGAAFGSASFRLTDCSHWPERAGCGQTCLQQIEQSPIDCLVRSHLAAWYAGKSCAICGQPVGTIDWYERRPALLGPDKATIGWGDVDAARLDEILAAYEPVCFDCHVAETFRRTHPELVLDNPYGRLPPGRQ